MSLNKYKVRSDELRAEIERLQTQLSEQRQLESRLEKTLQDLHIHQEELRTQNEDLLAAQGEIAASHRKYLNLFDHAPIGYFVLDQNGSIQQANLVAAKLLGRTRSKIINKPLWLYIHKTDRDNFQAHLRELWRGTPSFLETSLLQEENKPITVELHSTPAEYHENHIATVRIAVLDVTKRKEVESHLGEINQQLDSILATIPDIVFRLDRAGTIEYISPTVSNYGYRPGELLGQNFLKVICEKSRPKVLKQFNRQIQEGNLISDLEIGVQLRNRDDTIFEPDKIALFSICSTVLYTEDEAGREYISGIQGIAHDITEHSRHLQQQAILKEQPIKKQRIEAIDALAGGEAQGFNITITGIQEIVSRLKKLHQDNQKTSELLAQIEKFVNRIKQLLSIN